MEKDYILKGIVILIAMGLILWGSIMFVDMMQMKACSEEVDYWIDYCFENNFKGDFCQETPSCIDEFIETIEVQG